MSIFKTIQYCRPQARFDLPQAATLLGTRLTQQAREAFSSVRLNQLRPRPISTHFQRDCACCFVNA